MKGVTYFIQNLYGLICLELKVIFRIAADVYLVTSTPVFAFRFILS